MHDITLCLLHCHTKWKSNGKINNENVTQRLACSITSLQMEIKKTTLVSLISQCILLKNKVHSAVSVSLSSKSVFTLKGLNQCCAVLKDCMPVSCQCLSLLRSYGPKGVVLSTQYSKLLHCMPVVLYSHCIQLTVFKGIAAADNYRYEMICVVYRWKAHKVGEQKSS